MTSASSSFVLNHLLATVTSSIPTIGDFIPWMQNSMDQLMRHEFLVGPDRLLQRKKGRLILHGSSVLLNPRGITHPQWRLTLPFSGRLKKTKRKQESQTDTEVEPDADADSDADLDDEDEGKGSWSQKSYQIGAKCPIVAVKTSDEKNWERLFRTIYYNMRSRVKAKSSLLPFHTLPESRYWSSEFSTIPVPDATNSRKPDLVLMDYRLKKHNGNEKSWADVLTGVEITISELAEDIPIFLWIATKGYLIMREQPWHHFILLFSITNKNTYLINLDPVHFIDVLNTMMLNTKKEYALKDCWVDVDSLDHEVKFLQAVDGVPNVVQLVKYWDVDLPLTTFKSVPELVNMPVAHKTLTFEREVLHGDLSPNNLIIHEGKGYFIDFDHAKFVQLYNQAKDLWNKVYMMMDRDGLGTSGSLKKEFLMDKSPSFFSSRNSGSTSSSFKPDKPPCTFIGTIWPFIIIQHLLLHLLCLFRQIVLVVLGGKRGSPRFSRSNSLPLFQSSAHQPSAPIPSPNASQEESQTHAQSNRGVGGHIAQLQKAGERVMAAPTRQGKKNTVEISDSEENPMAPSQVARAKKKAPAKTSVKASAVWPERQRAHSPHPFLRTAHHSDRFGFKPPYVTDGDGQDVTQPGCSQNTRATEPGARQQDSPDHHSNNLEYDADENDMRDDEDVFRSFNDHNQQDEQDHEQDDDKDDSEDDDRGVSEGEDHNKDHNKDDEQDSRQYPQAYQNRYHDDNDLMELDQAQDSNIQANNERDDPGIFDVLERHQAKNGRHKAPSPSRLLSILVHTCSIAVSLSIYIPTSTVSSRMQPPSRGRALSRASPSRAGEQTKNQSNPVKLRFYPSYWQAFLQAAKLEMRLQAVLTHPIPEHSDAVELAREVLDVVLWKYHSKKIGLEQDVVVELKKIIISLAKQLYGICPKGSMMHEHSVQKHVTEAASKLIKSGDYLRLPDLSEGKYKNFVSQQRQKALKLTDEFQHSIPVNGVILVATVAKGVLTGFCETSIDKAPDLSADKCRSDFNSLRKSVDMLMDIPKRRRQLEEMLEEWAESGMMNWLCNDSDGGSANEDVNIII
ncbi:hypothetical protein DFJ58DRAFT_842963 [Suillus subalutaceus]|uniref:uncharacterized protein n=1 Tax=Suillus subalutaceus TaxID=48586 RepID=UPI001B873304|nr:uncharacterized protein DFJ58DRAFT_842963 [Suillus subalutaceus]KAG1848321.1 hypothetical protein DFJ58DRAFT_842963 [Suillus subalutaceus]